MMKRYLKAIITEQVNRGLCLKKLIEYPLKFSNLSGLAQRCENIIDSNIARLEMLSEELGKRDEDDVRDILRRIRRNIREIEMVEYFGISALRYATDETGYMNKLIFRIHKEINFPLNPPSVACISTMYYYFYSFTNVVFVPVGESNFILHLPDVFHELGHEVLFNKNELRLRKVNECYELAVTKVTEYYRELLSKKIRETGPKETPFVISHIHSQWKEHWLDEFFCDLFALYTLGPAYAWSHLHLTVKTSEDICQFSKFLPQIHPSDDSRMKMLLIGLKKLGFDKEASLVMSKWNNLPPVLNAEPVVEYQYAYPEGLMVELADIILAGLRESRFAIISPTNLRQHRSDTVIKQLNEAWISFWNKPDEFRDWEEICIEKLKAIVTEKS
jgi:hypothetical protein